MSDPAGILLVAGATSTTGGGERQVADLLRLLPPRGFRLGLVCPKGGDLSDLANESGVSLYPAEIASGFSLTSRKRVQAALGAFRPDIVHAHGPRAAAYARMSDPRASERVVYTLHGIHIDKAGTAIRRNSFLSVERMLRSRTAGFVTVCRADAEKGERLGILVPERTTVVYNGVDPVGSTSKPGTFRRELALPSSVPLALNIGRFHEQKDQRTLLAAWREVRSRVPEAVLAIVGSGPLESALRQQCIGLGLADSVRFVAPRADLGSAYSDADLFVLSSLWEGLPYVMLEAMSHGLPIVATAVDGVVEAVTDGRNGILVPPADAEALACSVAGLLADPDKRRMMGESGRAVVGRCFTLNTMVDGLEAVYRRVLQAADPPA